MTLCGLYYLLLRDTEVRGDGHDLKPRGISAASSPQDMASVRTPWGSDSSDGGSNKVGNFDMVSPVKLGRWNWCTLVSVGSKSRAERVTTLSGDRVWQLSKCLVITLYRLKHI